MLVNSLFRNVLILIALSGVAFISPQALADDQGSRWYDPRSWFDQSGQETAALAEVEAVDHKEAMADVQRNNGRDEIRLKRMIKVATRKQMLGQRMLAGYCLGGAGEQEMAEHMLKQAVEVFESQSAQIKDKPIELKPEVQEKLASIDAIWASLSSAAKGVKDEATATSLVEQTDLLVGESDQLVERIAAKLDRDVGELLSESGRQRMLGQRVSALALCKTTGVSELLVEGKIEAIMADLEQSNRALANRVGPNGYVQRELDAAHTNLEILKATIQAEQLDFYQLLEISDYFVENMSRAARKIADPGKSEA